MRFSSLFKTPKPQQFHIKPRYYDPVKEEMEERVERIRQSMEGKEASAYGRGQIQFKRSNKKTAGTSMVQLIIALVLGMLILGWLEFGDDILYYALWVVAPAYILFRAKRMKGRR